MPLHNKLGTPLTQTALITDKEHLLLAQLLAIRDIATKRKIGLY